MRLEELVETVADVLRATGYRVERISYPDSHDKRSIDVVASGGRSEGLLVKVVNDVDDLSVTDLRELHGCSSALRVPGLIVAERDSGVEIDPVAAHEKMGTYAVSIEGLRAVLEIGVYVIRKHNNYYMRVDGKKLRMRRLERGYSLGDVASYLSVSRRSVYLYEQEESLVSLSVALKLMELFGEDIFKPFDIIEGQVHEESRRVYTAISQSSSRAQIARILSSLGYDVVATRRIPPDVVAGRGDRRRVIVVVEKKRDKNLERRIEEAEKVARQLRARIVAYVRDERLPPSYDVEVARSTEEFEGIVRGGE